MCSLAGASEKFVSMLIKADVICEEKRKVYNYCFECLFAELLNLAIVASAAIVSGKPLTVLMFSVSFLPLRKWSGGYHAKTHLGCMLTLSAVTVTLIILESKLPMNVRYCFQLAVPVPSAVIIALLSPMESPCKPITEKQRRSFWRISCVLSFVIAAAAVALSILGCRSVFGLSYGILTVAVFMLVQKLIKRYSDRCHTNGVC